MLLTKKTDSVAAAGPRLRRAVGARIADDGPADVSEALGPGRRCRRVRKPAALRRDRQGRRRRGCGRGEGKKEIRRTVCTHCSVGCAIDATIENGVWTRQDPVFESPLNLGAHCAKGASVREHAFGTSRVKTPMKLVNGKWQSIKWDQAINEIGDKMLAIRKESGPDAVYWVGSSKHSNEQSYLMRKFVVVLGHEQLRPPGADLPFDDGRRRSQHVGLRRDDQLVQRHAEFEVRDVHRLERGRGAPGVDAVHPAREGNRHQDDRRRPALHADGGEGRRIRAAARRRRHPVPLRDAVAHLQERLGRQGLHRRPRLRDGQGEGRGARQLDAGQGRGRLRRARGDGATRSPR